jgi:fumarate hydratase subunit beta
MAEYTLNFPLKDEDITKLKIGDVIYVNGLMIMARDEAHHRALEFAKEGKPLPVDLVGNGLFHCGPVVMKNPDETWTVKAAGPTTSSRMNLFESEFIEQFKIKIIVGKGGMDKRTSEALQKHKAVYCAFTGGAGVIAAKGIKDSKMKDVHWLDLGTPEALWVFEAQKFGPLIVAMDSHGDSLYDIVRKQAADNIKLIEEQYAVKLT